MDFDSRQFRDVLGRFPSGVTVVTSGKEPMFRGMTAQSFSSLSLDPPLVLVCVDKSADMLQLLKESRIFTVNILSTDQEALSNFFADKSRPDPPRQFDEIPYSLGETGAPRIAGATTAFDCTLREVFDAGDHEIFVGEVKAFENQNDDSPILFFQGQYRVLAD